MKIKVLTSYSQGIEFHAETCSHNKQQHDERGTKFIEVTNPFNIAEVMHLINVWYAKNYWEHDFEEGETAEQFVASGRHFTVDYKSARNFAAVFPCVKVAKKTGAVK